MESTQRAVSANTAPLSEEDWDELIDFIREEYLVRDRGIHDVFGSLQERKPQMTYVYILILTILLRVYFLILV